MHLKVPDDLGNFSGTWWGHVCLSRWIPLVWVSLECQCYTSV